MAENLDNVKKPIYATVGAGDVVVQADGLVDGREGVEAVVAQRAHEELEVDLRRGAHGDGRGRLEDGGHGVTLAMSSSVTRAKSATPICSPRVRGSMPAARKASSAAAPEP